MTALLDERERLRAVAAQARSEASLAESNVRDAPRRGQAREDQIKAEVDRLLLAGDGKGARSFRAEQYAAMESDGWERIEQLVLGRDGDPRHAESQRSWANPLVEHEGGIAARRAERAERDVRTFTIENIDALLAELHDVEQPIVATATQALAELRVARRALADLGAAWAGVASNADVPAGLTDFSAEVNAACAAADAVLAERERMGMRYPRRCCRSWSRWR